MRIWPLKCTLFIALALSSDPIARNAFAVAGKTNKLPLTVAPVVQPGQNIYKKIELPVTWQITRSRLVGTDNSTVTETYRETWILEIQTGGIYHLRSPRAVIPAFASDQSPSETGHVPTALTVSESDFGKLIGVKRKESDIDTSEPLDRPVSISLASKKRPDSEILLTWSDDEHLVIQLDFSSAGLF